MAAVATQVPSAARVEEGSFSVTAAAYPREASVKCEPAEVAQQWTDQLSSALKSGNSKELRGLFMEESYWRDQLCFSWDFRTIHGSQKIIDFIEGGKKEFKVTSVAVDTSAAHRCPSISAIDVHGKVQCVQLWIKVETVVGKGLGIAKLIQDPSDGNKWKAFTLFTTLRSLVGHEESTGKNRPNGVTHGANIGRKNWQDRRNAQNELKSGDPTILIIGGGQAGLTVAARLKQLGIESLIIDRNSRIGDNWRNRYHQLVLHDPVWYDHMPYLPFPEHWPIFTPKDKLAEWFESYAKILELNVWNNTSIENSKWDEKSEQWTVNLKTMVDGKENSRQLCPKHIIQATGHSGEMNFPSDIKGLSDFKGDVLCHSSEFRGARDGNKGKKAIVVGCCNSGHDIAQDYYEKGYDITMIQRSTTCVISSKNVLEVTLSGLYEENSIFPTEDADLIFNAIPVPLLKTLQTDATVIISEKEASLRSALTAAGFALDNGPDESGFWFKYVQRGGGYYLDVGASQLIADKKIKIKQGVEIDHLKAHSIVFQDGTELEADEIVFATGYKNMRGMARKIFGDEVADKLKDVWGLDEEGETRTIWRGSGHPGFWFMGGNLAMCRYFSRLLALQIKAKEEGLMH